MSRGLSSRPSRGRFSNRCFRIRSCETEGVRVFCATHERLWRSFQREQCRYLRDDTGKTSSVQLFGNENHRLCCGSSVTCFTTGVRKSRKTNNHTSARKKKYVGTVCSALGCEAERSIFFSCQNDSVFVVTPAGEPEVYSLLEPG